LPERGGAPGGRIVLLGATGYTGRLTAKALVERGLTPVLAGRSVERLGPLSRELGDLDFAIADVREPKTMKALVGPGDVIVSTVGPFVRLGSAAVETAIAARASYLDSSGEPSFVRRVFERHGPVARQAGTSLLPSFAFDSVPGNLAAATALKRAGEGARRVDIGYFMPGDRRGWDSGGSRASFLTAAIEPSFVWRGGIRTERGAARIRSFALARGYCTAVSAGTSEHFALPRLYPQLREVNSYLGYLAGAPRMMQALSLLGAGVARLPGVRSTLRALTRRLARGSTGGPDALARAKTTSEVVAIAYGEGGRELATVRLAGANSYEFSARILAFGASQAVEGRISGVGALGPVEAVGRHALETGCRDAGMVAV
jgi:short subunit dehydrogenase-like uncharacterized protein